MSWHPRQLIFFVVLIVFSVSLVWLLLYSAGYRLNWSSLTLQPTGSIRLVVEQADVLISLLPSGERKLARSANFTHLTPGQYHLYLEANGYRTSHYQLEVVPGRTLVLQSVRLWPDTTLTKLAKPLPDKTFVNTERPFINNSFEIKFSGQTITRLSTPIKAAIQLADSPYIVYVTAEQLHVIDTRVDTNFSDVVLAQTADRIDAVAYQPDKDRLVIRTNGGDYAFSLSVSTDR